MKNYNSHKEGEVAKTLENETAKLPSDVWLWAAVGSMAISLGCFLSGKKHSSTFFGQWAPSLLVIGLYNKLVKVEGHDKEDKSEGNEDKDGVPQNNSYAGASAF